MFVMGRSIPADNLSLIHPVLYLSFIAAGFAASIAITTALCSVRFRKKEESSDPVALSKESEPSSRDANADPPAKAEDSAETGNDDFEKKELPLPPAMQLAAEPNVNNIMKRATSERKISMNFSMKLPKSLSVARNWDHQERKGKMKPEDSVWMKTIILGDKCKVPDEEEAVIYEGKGKKISAYHPKPNSSLSLSRQSSFNGHDVIIELPTQIKEEKDR